MVGDSNTLCSDTFLAALLEYIEEKGCVISAFSYDGDNFVTSDGIETLKDEIKSNSIVNKSGFKIASLISKKDFKEKEKKVQNVKKASSMTNNEKKKIRNIFCAQFENFKETGIIDGCTEDGGELKSFFS